MNNTKINFFLNAQLMKYITHSFQSGLMFQNIHNVNDHLHALVSFAPKHSGFCNTKMPNHADWHTTVLHRVKISTWTQPGKCETCSWSRHCQWLELNLPWGSVHGFLRRALLWSKAFIFHLHKTMQLRFYPGLVFLGSDGLWNRTKCAE